MVNYGVCSECGVLLKREDWNEATDIIVCDNFKCPVFRRPIRQKRNSIARAEKREPVEELPEWLGGPIDGKDDSFTTRLQRLRRTLRTEDEETEIP